MENLRIFKRIFSLVLLILLPSFLFSDTDLNGAEIYKKKCSGCHGVEGTTPAYGISRKLTELTQDELKDKLKFYTAHDIINSKGVTAVMGKQTAKLNKQEYDEVLKFIVSEFAVKNQAM